MPSSPQRAAARRETPEAGRELDALIAEKVMGWTADQFRYHAVERDDNSPYHASFGMGDATLSEITAACAHYASRRFRPEVANVPEYSTDIAAAWLVVEKLRATGNRQWWVRVETADDHDEWTCQVWDDPEDNPIGMATESTPPLAICRAALAAVEASADAAR